MNTLNRKGLIVVGIVLCLMTVLGSPALAQPLSGAGVVGDLVILRPVGFAATVLGTAFFIVTLPFTVWSGDSLRVASTYLVEDPFAYTFIRPLGAWDAPP